MSEKSLPPNALPEAFPEAVVRPAHRFRLIWLVPIAAALIGIWLSVKAVVEAGPAIIIRFKSAEGLVAGITKVKYKDVEIGQVRSIRLSEDLSAVRVEASMVKEVEKYLNGDTRFWEVRARLAGGELSGLGTLLSGAYIGMDPGQKGAPAHDFIGLETPPVVTMDTPGSYFQLRAGRLGSLDVGSPVYLHQIKVGQVVSYALGPDDSALVIDIFVESPHDRKVFENTRFWNASGIDINLDSKGLRINTDSLVSLLLGGVAFEVPSNEIPGPLAAEGKRFYLYPSRDKIQEPIYAERFYAKAYFDKSVRGLFQGAPVEFKGIKVGEVVDVQLEYDPERFAARVPVLMVFEPQRLSIEGSDYAQADGMFEKLVEKGLSAQLRTAVLLTGHLYINLTMDPNATERTLGYADGYPVIPTIESPTEDLVAGISHFINRLENLPMEEISGDLQQNLRSLQRLLDSRDLTAAMTQLRQSLEQINRFATALNTDTAPQLNKILDEADQALVQIQSTIDTAEHFMGSDAPLTYEMRQMLLELSKAGRAVSTLVDYLERHPEALIKGKGAPNP